MGDRSAAVTPSKDDLNHAELVFKELSRLAEDEAKIYRIGIAIAVARAEEQRTNRLA
jgi:hypothetical protein